MNYQNGNIWEAESPSPAITGHEATSPCQTLTRVHPCAHQVSALSILEALGHSLPHHIPAGIQPCRVYCSLSSSLVILELQQLPLHCWAWPWGCPTWNPSLWGLKELGTGCAGKSSIFSNFNSGVQISIMHSNYCLQQAQSLENSTWCLKSLSGLLQQFYRL